MYKLLHPANVQTYWNKVAPWIAQALGAAEAWEDLGYIRDRACLNHYQIWVGFEPGTEEIELVLITEGIIIGARPILVCRWASAVNMGNLLPDFGLIEAYAKEKGFYKVQIWGRKGWEKVFKPLGYTHEFTVITRTLERGFN